MEQSKHISSLFLTVVSKEATDIHGNTPMMSGLIEGSFGSEECVRMLIEYDANINHLNNLKQTPLYAAIHQQSKLISGFLLEEGADVNYRNPTDDSSLLHTVCAVGLTHIVGKLLSYIDINDRNRLDMTPLLYMIENFKSLKTPMELVVVIFRALIDANADLSIPDHHGNTLLHLIAEHNLGELLDLLTTDFEEKLEFVDLDQLNFDGN
jgi:ankyrin repeat protein